MSPNLQVLLFLMVISLPLVLFGIYTGLVKKWPLSKLTPYSVGYIGALAAVLGTAMGLRGWYLFLAILTCMLGTWVGMKSWSAAFDNEGDSGDQKTSHR